MSQHHDIKTVTHKTLRAMKQRGEKITSLTAYDASFAHILDHAGIDVILIGDSLGMVIQGETSTVPVTVEQMVYHTRCVSNATQRAFILADMPFMSYQNETEAAHNAAQLMQAGKAHMVKLEGGQKVASIVKHLVEQGIPVCGHLGLLPQSVHQLGGYRVQGKEESAAKQLIDEAKMLEQAGANLLIVECIPAALGQRVSQSVDIPVIGIGAGADCDGQVLVSYDMLDITVGKRPSFSKNFMAESSSVANAVENYVAAVKDKTFPTDEHCF